MSEWRGDDEEARLVDMEALDMDATEYGLTYGTTHVPELYLNLIRRARAAERRKALEEATAECRKEERHQETIIQRSDRKPLRATPGLSESAAAARIRMAIRALIDDSEGT